MAIKFNRSQTFATNGTVTAAGLHNLIDGTDIYQALITDQTNLTSVGSADELLIADADLTANDAPRAVTVNELFEDALTISTYTNANINNISYGTSTGTRLVSTNASITTGTIPNLTSSTASITIGTIPTLTAGTTTSTVATITTGTIPNLTIGSTTATAGTITNFTTTLTGDFTISQGAGTLGTTGVTAGTYGASGIIPTLSVDAKGRVTTVSTSSLTIADASITPAKLSQPLTLGTAVASTSGTAIDFTSIPSWAKRITVMLNAVSTNGTAQTMIQIGTSGGIQTTGYSVNTTSISASANSAANYTNGWQLFTASAASLVFSGALTLTLQDSSGIWAGTGLFSLSSPSVIITSGIKNLSGTLDRIRITTANGTDAFDAGTVNIMYEG